MPKTIATIGKRPKTTFSILYSVVRRSVWPRPILLSMLAEMSEGEPSSRLSVYFRRGFSIYEVSILFAFKDASANFVMTNTEREIGKERAEMMRMIRPIFLLLVIR